MNAPDTPGAASPSGTERTTYVPLHEAVGRGLRSAREAAGVTQDVIARQTRLLGLSWDRAKVAALERGEKPLSAEELLILIMVTNSLGIAKGIESLLAGLDKRVVVLLGRRHGISAASIVSILSGRASINIGAGETPIEENASLRRLDQYAETEDAAVLRAAKLGFRDVSYHAWRRAFGESGEAEQKVARRFDESVLVILAACVALWGHSLTHVRDEEVAKLVEESEEDVSPRRLQALRGHVTRRLVDELDEVLRPEVAQARAARRDAMSVLGRAVSAKQRAVKGGDMKELRRLEMQEVEAGEVFALAEVAVAMAEARWAAEQDS